MPKDENNKNKTGEASVDEQGNAFTEGETFVEYIVRQNRAQMTGAEKDPLGGLGGAFDFRLLLEHIKWENDVSSTFRKPNLLISSLSHNHCPKETSTYEFIARCDNDKKREFFQQELPMVARKIDMYVKLPQRDFDSLRFLKEFFVPVVVRDVENQILNGKGEQGELKGMLMQGGESKQQGDLLNICLNAVGEFWENSRRISPVLVMSLRQKLCLAKILSHNSPDSLATGGGMFLSHFIDIPIVMSDFIPDENIMLVDFENVSIVSAEGTSRLWTNGPNGNVTGFCYEFKCNIAVKDPRAIMRVVLPKGCLQNTPDVRLRGLPLSRSRNR